MLLLQDLPFITWHKSTTTHLFYCLTTLDIFFNCSSYFICMYVCMYVCMYFYGCTHGMWRFLGQGLNFEPQLWPTQQLWQHRILTLLSWAGELNLRLRSDLSLKLDSSSAAPEQELPTLAIFQVKCFCQQ